MDADLVNRRFEHAQRVDGAIDEHYAGESLTVPITYDNPFTGQRVQTTFTVLNYDERPQPGASVAIDVGRDNPRAIRFAGRAVDPGEDRIEIGGLIALLLSGPLLARWFGLARVRRLIASHQPSFVMVGALTARRRGRRPLLHLYPLDDDASSSAVCVVPLAASVGLPIDGRAFTVEVKGSPRPFGRVVARLESGEILWPAARALASRGDHSRPDVATIEPLPHTTRPMNVRLVPFWRQMPLELLGFGVAAAAGVVVTVMTLANSAAAERVAERSLRVDAVVVATGSSHVIVRFPWEGAEITARAPAQSGGGYQEGLKYPVLVDPLRSTSVRTAMEPYNAVGPIVLVWLTTGVTLVLVARRVAQRLFARRNVRVGPWFDMLAVPVQTTARFAVLQVFAARDWPGSRRGLILAPRNDPWTNGTQPRDVVVCGSLNPFDAPAIVALDRVHVPAARIIFGAPWHNWARSRARGKRRGIDPRRPTQPGWSET
jgi:hypothetical protein